MFVKIKYIFIFFLLILIFPVNSFAHKVNVFAWVDGDMIHTQSKFSRGKTVKNAKVILIDTNNNELAQGSTDDQGECSFKIPKYGENLKVILYASMGHQAQWEIPAQELSPSSTDMPPEKMTKVETPTQTYTLNKEQQNISITKEDLQKLVDNSLDKKLKPIHAMLTQYLVDKEPGITEIIGGIGYIFGLACAALLILKRNGKSN